MAADDGSKSAGTFQSTTTKRVKERRQYTEDCLQDDEIEGRRMFSVEEKLASDKFELFFVKEMKGTDFNLRYIQEHGFDTPVVVKEKTGLGMRMPSSNFTVNDVRQCVGSRRLLDVMDVTTQKDIEMTMKDWCRYFESTNRDKLLNVISLEFSHTKLENYVESPTLVRQADWVDLVWPRHLKESQTEGTNVIEEMKYPKVQKYCLMSVKGCYTDFHIDFGGTSVWYHIMRGQKVFWLIPPTERNLQLYEQWVLSGKQGDVFFGDTVEKCAKVHLHAGYTFFIPTGWIHAVFTPEDSLVFGGNFLHSFGMEKQIRIFGVEDITHVPPKFRYPFYVEMMWYVLQRYVFCLIGKNHLICNENGDPISLNEAAAGKGNLVPPPMRDPNQSIAASVLANGFSLKDPADVAMPLDISLPNNGIDGGGGDLTKASFPGGIRPYVHLTKMEYSGLKVIYKWLQSLPSNKKAVPELIRSHDALLSDVKIMLHEHKTDDTQLALTGQPSLFWSIPPKKRSKQPRPNGGPSTSSSKSKSGGGKGSNNNARRRRTRCKKCEACLRADCGECHFCKDMKKFGGPGRMKQSCISRQCMAPVLPHTACCMLCGRDGWEKVNNPQENEISSLMECSQCWEIVHPACLHDKNPDLPMEGLASDDLPNSWECPKCCRDGKPDQVKPRNAKTPIKVPTPQMPLNLVTTGGGGVAMPIDLATPQVNPLVLETPTNLVVGDEENLSFLAAAANMKAEVRYLEEAGHDVTSLEPMRKKVKSEVKHEFCDSAPSSGDENNPRDMTALQRIANRSSSLSSLADADDGDIVEDKLLLQQEISAKKATSHVRSCARFTLNPTRNIVKEEKDSSPPQQTPPQPQQQPQPQHPGKSVSPTKLTLKYTSNKVVGLDLRRNSNGGGANRAVLGVNGRKHVETARERLFRNLKGLKKNSELLRHNVLRVKTKNLSSDTALAQKESPETKVLKLEDNVEARTCHQENSGDEENSDTNKSNGLNECKGLNVKTGDKNASTNPAKRFSMTLREKANLRKPKYVVRPAPILEDTIKDKQTKNNCKMNDDNNLALEKEVMLPVFQYLPVSDLLNCQLVCKAWNRWCIDPRLWTYMDVSRKKISPNLLMGIIRRQPVSLNLSWTNINRRQLSWLISRLPQMKDLVLSGCAAVSILALCTSSCPLLRSLDLCWAEGLTDSVIRDLLSAPTDSRPGFVEAKTRLRQLMEVRVAGADISDVAVRLLAHHLPLLSRMDLSHCHKVTDMGIAVLGAAKSARLTHLDVSSCSNISDTSLEALKRCANLMLLDMRECPQVTEPACQKFVSHGRHVLTLKEGRLMERIYS